MQNLKRKCFYFLTNVLTSYYKVCWRQKEWSTLLQAILHISSKMSSKRWRTLGEEANKINKQIEQIENSFAFSFIEVKFSWIVITF